MVKLLVLKGLPASGKSTFAKELVSSDPKWKRVNKDDLREMVDGGKWSKANEKHIKDVRDALIIGWLTTDKNVVVDDTNLFPEHEVTFKKMASSFGADLEIKFFDTPVMECIERDSKRGEKSVGAKVIMGMYNQYLKPKEPEYSDDKTNVYVFDIDGTLALMNGRNPFDYTKVLSDIPNHNITMIARVLKQSGLPIIIVSGRSDDCREDTEKWLINNFVPYDELFMRKAGDVRKDSIVKQEIYETHLKPSYNVLAVFDDRNQVVDMWRSLGLTCLQVNYGFF